MTSSVFRSPWATQNTTRHYNKMKPLNFGFIFTFSFISMVSNWLPTHGKFRSTVYAASVLSLIGFSMIVAWKPEGFFQLYGAVFQEAVYRIWTMFINVSREDVNVYANIYTMYVVAFGIHILPLYVFRKQWKHRLGNPLLLLLIYAILFYPWVESIYPVSIPQLFVIAVLSWSILQASSFIEDVSVNV